MEPIFTESVSETVTAELAAQLAQARAALPPSYCLDPQERELTESKEAAFVRLQNWAFTKGFAIVKESAKTKDGQVIRQYFDCVHHKNKTKNCRKLNEEERQRIQTKTQSNGCKFSLVVSYAKDPGSWIIRSKCLEHNHAPNPDPFSYHQHKDKVPGYAAAVAAGSMHRGVVGYKEHTALLKKDDLPRISKKQFYNLQRKEEAGTMTKQQELGYILQLLEAEGIHVRCRVEYTLDDGGERTSQVIKDLFWMSPEQIKMTQRFVSGFMYEIDATFNIEAPIECRSWH